jgi:Pentapeptide repeats (9 copies)
MELITQKEFVERYKNGEKLFENILLQFSDIYNIEFLDLTIKNSRIFFSNFWSCDMKNVRFEDCDIYWAGFYNQKMYNVIFDGCKIELSIFENIQFDRAKMHRCNTRLSGVLFSNAASMDMSTSVHNKLITDLAQVTRQDIDALISETMSVIERLDFNTRMKIKDVIRNDMERYGLGKPEEKREGSYDNKREDAKLSYGEVRLMVEASFGAYAQPKVYEMKSPYEIQDRAKTKRSGPPF